MNIFKVFTRSILVSYLLSVLSLLLLAFLLYQFKLPVAKVSFLVYAIYGISCLVGGLISGKSMKTRRFFWGFLFGLLYFLLLVLASFILQHQLSADTTKLLSVLGLCALGGMVGGMLS